MSVLDNMMLAAQNQIGEVMRRGLPERLASPGARGRAARAEILDEFNMTHMKGEYAGALSGGQRKLLEMARAMMANPSLIMLDEPMAGVNPALTQSLLGHVKRLRSEGITVMFVEHDMDVVQDISDWVVVMAEGSIIAEGTPARSARTRRSSTRISALTPTATSSTSRAEVASEARPIAGIVPDADHEPMSPRRGRSTPDGWIH